MEVFVVGERRALEDLEGVNDGKTTVELATGDVVVQVLGSAGVCAKNSLSSKKTLGRDGNRGVNPAGCKHLGDTFPSSKPTSSRSTAAAAAAQPNSSALE